MYDIFEELNKFNNITYYDQPHKYLMNGKYATSVTTLIHKYQPPFDKDRIAYFSAKKAGITVEEILAKWDLKAKIACEKGTICHQYMENFIQNKVFPYPVDHIRKIFGNDPVKHSYDVISKQIETFCAHIAGKMIAIRSELVVGDQEYNICGMIDQLFYNKKSNMLELWDWKTNEKIDDYSEYPLLEPINHLNQSKLDIYSLQLSLYKYIIEKNTN
jgi:ATP-dependent exoDNAse (exonuclease V) beta subunit